VTWVFTGQKRPDEVFLREAGHNNNKIIAAIIAATTTTTPSFLGQPG